MSREFPPRKAPPRKVYSINSAGRRQLAEFWETWAFLAERIEQLHAQGGSNREAQQQGEQ